MSFIDEVANVVLIAEYQKGIGVVDGVYAGIAEDVLDIIDRKYILLEKGMLDHMQGNLAEQLYETIREKHLSGEWEMELQELEQKHMEEQDDD
jgi:hypothetical protein